MLKKDLFLHLWLSGFRAVQYFHKATLTNDATTTKLDYQSPVLL